MNKLVKLSDTHYILVDDSKIKINDWVYSMDGIHQWFGLVLKTESLPKKITHSTQPLNTKFNDWSDVQIITLSEVEEAINGYSVDKMAQQYTDERNYLTEEEQGFIDGFKAHQELVKDKSFTLKDMKMMFVYAHQVGMNTVLQIQSPNLFPKQDTNKLRDEFIQSLLSPTVWDIEFVDGKIELI